MILEVNPSTKDGNSTYIDIIKVASAYAKSNIQNLINTSKIRYIDKNNDRVSNWLKVNRLQLPLPSTQSDSVKGRIPQTTEKVNTSDENSSKNIRSKSRSTVTSGQYEQMKANLSHSKVYSKKSAMELVSKIAPGIRNRSFEALSNQLWEGLNSYTTTDERRAFATDMAEIFVDRMVVDTLVKHSEWDSAVERMAYLKPTLQTNNKLLQKIL